MANKDATTSFDFEFVVLHQFGDNERGKLISDAAEIAKVIEAGDDRHCIRKAKA